MIKLSNAVVVANTSDELTVLQSLLNASYPDFVYQVVDNTGSEKESFPFKMLVQIDQSIPNVSMPDFFDFLVLKIDQLNQPA